MNKKNDYRTYANRDDPKYLIACDLDGTLLNNESELSALTIKSIKKIIDNGHKVCLVTGRPLRGCIDFYKKLNLDTVLVTQNGSYITNPSDKKFIPIINAFCIKIFKDIFTNEVIMKYTKNALIEGVNKGWLWNEAENESISLQLMDMFHLKDRDIITVNKNINSIDTDITSILLHIDDLSILNLLIYEIKNIAPTLVVRNWSLPNNGNIIEINSHYASKKTGLTYLSSYYGVPIELCLAFGDGDNDVSMLAEAVWSFATKNATPAARLAARYMTKENNDDNGVVRELINFLKIDN